MKQVKKLQEQMASCEVTQNKFCTMFGLHQPTVNILMNAEIKLQDIQAKIKYMQEHKA